MWSNAKRIKDIISAKTEWQKQNGKNRMAKTEWQKQNGKNRMAKTERQKQNGKTDRIKGLKIAILPE